MRDKQIKQIVCLPSSKYLWSYYIWFYGISK